MTSTSMHFSLRWANCVLSRARSWPCRAYRERPFLALACTERAQAPATRSDARSPAAWYSPASA
eukprot:6202306-Pleurochrysis_carterae.AAC.2